MEKKNIIKCIILIIILLFIVFFVREFIIWNDGILDKNNILGRDEVIELVRKGISYPNYHSSPEVKPTPTKEPLKADIYVKDNIEAYYINSQLTNWTNYNTGERIFISKSGNDTIATIVSDAKVQENMQNGYDYTEIMDDNFEYKYIGEKDIFGRRAILIQLKNGSNVKKYAIDKETGLILQNIEYYKKCLFITFKTTINTNLELDVVKDVDIERPDLTDVIVKKI